MTYRDYQRRLTNVNDDLYPMQKELPQLVASAKERTERAIDSLGFKSHACQLQSSQHKWNQ